jgi:hypothetical protein
LTILDPVRGAQLPLGVDNGVKQHVPFVEWGVSVSSDVSPDAGSDPPDWAVGQAMSQLVDGDGPAIEERARQLMQDFDDERHDEDDDADEGGEG